MDNLLFLFLIRVNFHFSIAHKVQPLKGKFTKLNVMSDSHANCFYEMHKGGIISVKKKTMHCVTIFRLCSPVILRGLLISWYLLLQLKNICNNLHKWFLINKNLRELLAKEVDSFLQERDFSWMEKSVQVWLLEQTEHTFLSKTNISKLKHLKAKPSFIDWFRFACLHSSAHSVET